MAVCETCGNDYEDAFTVTMGGSTHTFDSFECAVHALAPKCSHCGCRVIGHGVHGEAGRIYCCEHCAGANWRRPTGTIGGPLDACAAILVYLRSAAVPSGWRAPQTGAGRPPRSPRSTSFSSGAAST